MLNTALVTPEESQNYKENRNDINVLFLVRLPLAINIAKDLFKFDL